jgi:hypothetical protein
MFRSLALLASVLAAAAIASAAVASSYRYAGADRYDVIGSTVTASLPSATLTDEYHHVLAMFSEGTVDAQGHSYWIQGGIARGNICGTNPNPFGQWVYVEVEQVGTPACNDPGYTLIVVYSSIPTGQAHTFQIAYCASGGGCHCHSSPTGLEQPFGSGLTPVSVAPQFVVAPKGGPRGLIARGPVPTTRSQSSRPMTVTSDASLTPDLICDWDFDTWGIYVDGTLVSWDASLLGSGPVTEGLTEDGAGDVANDSGTSNFRNYTKTMTYLCDATHQTLNLCAGTATWVGNQSNWNGVL